MPILVLAIDLYQYWHYMIHTSTGRHTKIPILVLARVTKEKILAWAATWYFHTSIGNRSIPGQYWHYGTISMRVLVLAKSRECQYWYKRDSNATIPVLETMCAADADQSRKKILRSRNHRARLGKESKH
jgi:hypothetical protein